MKGSVGLQAAYLKNLRIWFSLKRLNSRNRIVKRVGFGPTDSDSGRVQIHIYDTIFRSALGSSKISGRVEPINPRSRPV
ncbi:hypothetical protein Hanom_Chr17g01534651 [Helianthus anomalus]